MSLEAAVDNLAKVADDLVERFDRVEQLDLAKRLDRIQALLQSILGALPPPVPVAPPPPPPPAPVVPPPAATKAARAAEAVIKAAIEVVTPPVPANPVVLDYVQDVQPALLRLAAKKGRQALVDLLKAHGVSKGADLPAANYPAVLGAVTLALAEDAS